MQTQTGCALEVMEVGVCSSGGFLIGWLVEHSANENVSVIIVFSCAAGDGDFKGCVSLTAGSFYFIKIQVQSVCWAV